MEALSSLSWMPKYPAKTDDLKFISRILATFVQTVEVNDWDPDDVEWSQEHCLGWVNPLRWLMDEVSQTCQVFPVPIRFRKIYEQHFHPLDNRTANSLESVIED